jgi:hypothetical protein
MQALLETILTPFVVAVRFLVLGAVYGRDYEAKAEASRQNQPIL